MSPKENCPTAREKIIMKVKFIILTEKVESVFISQEGMRVVLKNGKEMFFEEEKNGNLDSG